MSEKVEQTVLLDGETLDPAKIVLVALHNAPVRLTESAIKRIKQARQVVDQHLSRSEPVYGLNTDVGAYKGLRIPDQDMAAFQANMVAQHSFAFGTELDTTTVRAMMLVRANGFAKGGAGVRLELAEKLIELLNKQLHPIVSGESSVGESDLSEMAQIAQVLIGEGHAHYAGKRLTARQALNEAGITPLKLEAKEGLALISANGLTLGLGALVLVDATALLHAFDLSAALALEGFGGNLSPLSPAAATLKPHPGLTRTRQRLARLLQGSSLEQAGAPRNLQDPLSFRCIAHVHGALDEALNTLTQTLQIELNAASDNPLVDIQTGSIVSVGNFDITNLAIGFDTLRIAIAHALNLANERIQKLMTSSFSALPTGLESPSNPLSRLMPLSRIAAALTAQAQTLATPASLTCKAQIEEGIEDHSSAAPLTVTKTRELIGIAQKIISLELLSAATAVVLSDRHELGLGTECAFQFIKADLPLTSENWPACSQRILAAVSSGELTDRVTKYLITEPNSRS